MGIEETVYPACVGCIADLACPVFLNAETQLELQRTVLSRVTCRHQKAFAFSKEMLKRITG